MSNIVIAIAKGRIEKDVYRRLKIYISLNYKKNFYYYMSEWMVKFKLYIFNIINNPKS